MLVLGSLGPGGDQVGELEVPRRQVPADDPGLVGVVLVEHARARAGADPRGCRRDRRRSSAPYAGPAQSRVGASKTTSTSRMPVSRSINARSAESTSWITPLSLLRAAYAGPAAADPPWGQPRLPHRAPFATLAADAGRLAVRPGRPRARTALGFDHGRPADQPGQRARLRAARWSGAGHRHRHQPRDGRRGLPAAGPRSDRGVGRGRAAGGVGLPAAGGHRRGRLLPADRHQRARRDSSRSG